MLNYLPNATLHAVKKALIDVDSLATTLRVCIDALFGEGAFSKDEDMQLDPILIHRVIYDEFDLIIPEENENRINALMVGTQSDQFYTDDIAFRAVCNSLLEGDTPDALLDDVTVQELMWALFELSLNRDPADVSTLSTGPVRTMQYVIETNGEELHDFEDDEEVPGAEGFLDYNKVILINQLDALQLNWTKIPWLQPLAHPPR